MADEMAHNLRACFKLYVGPMFSNKSADMLIEASRYESIGMRVAYFKPRVDTRDEEKGVWESRLWSRVGIERPANEVSDWREVLTRTLGSGAQVVVVDELQFMPTFGARAVTWALLQAERAVLMAGLLATTEMEQFPTTQALIPFADELRHSHALCRICGAQAPFTICTVRKTSEVLIGDGIYEARCRAHLEVRNPNYQETASNASR